jgi:hypothetical protein
MSKSRKINVANPLDRFIEKRSKLVPYPFPGVTDHTLFAGTTKSGKSHLIKTWLAGPYNKVFNDIFIINKTADKENYNKIFDIPEDNLLTTITDESLNELFEDLKKRFHHRKGDYCPLLIFDDCVDTLNKIDEFPIFLSTCRHYAISVWIAVQYVRNIRPPVRNQFINFVVFPYISPENTKAVGEASIGGRELGKYLKIVREENKRGNTRYGYLMWSKTYPSERFYGLEIDLSEIRAGDDDSSDSDVGEIRLDEEV